MKNNGRKRELGGTIFIAFPTDVNIMEAVLDIRSSMLTFYQTSRKGNMESHLSSLRAEGRKIEARLLVFELII